MVKRSSDHQVAYPEVKLQERDLVRVVGIVVPFVPLGAGTREKFVLSSSREKMGTGDLCRVPPAAVRHGRTRKTSGTGLHGIVEGSCGYRARGVSIRRKFVLSRNLWYKTRGVAIWINVVLTPGSLPRSQTAGTGPSASCGYCCPVCPTGGRYTGKSRCIEPREKMGRGELHWVPPAAVRHGRARQTSGMEPCGGCRQVQWVPGPWGQYSGKIRLIEKPGVQDEGSPHMAKRSSDLQVAYPKVKLQVRDL